MDLEGGEPGGRGNWGPVSGDSAAKLSSIIANPWKARERESDVTRMATVRRMLSGYRREKLLSGHAGGLIFR